MRLVPKANSTAFRSQKQIWSEKQIWSQKQSELGPFVLIATPPNLNFEHIAPIGLTIGYHPVKPGDVCVFVSQNLTKYQKWSEIQKWSQKQIVSQYQKWSEIQKWSQKQIVFQLRTFVPKAYFGPKSRWF
jgi:hypothetical protein